jgi:hypothetical protein
MPPGGGSPASFDLPGEFRFVPWGFVVPPNGGESEIVTMNCHTEIPPKDHILLNDSKNRPFLMIALRYRDILGNDGYEYESGFCFILDPDYPRYVLTNDGAPRNFWRRLNQ